MFFNKTSASSSTQLDCPFSFTNANGCKRDTRKGNSYPWQTYCKNVTTLTNEVNDHSSTFLTDAIRMEHTSVALCGMVITYRFINTLSFPLSSPSICLLLLLVSLIRERSDPPCISLRLRTLVKVGWWLCLVFRVAIHRCTFLVVLFFAWHICFASQLKTRKANNGTTKKKGQ